MGVSHVLMWVLVTPSYHPHPTPGLLTRCWDLSPFSLLPREVQFVSQLLSGLGPVLLCAQPTSSLKKTELSNANSSSASGGISCLLFPSSCNLHTNAVHTVTIPVWSPVHLLCCVWKTQFPWSYFHFWFLQPFCTLFHKYSWERCLESSLWSVKYIFTSQNMSPMKYIILWTMC